MRFVAKKIGDGRYEIESIADLPAIMGLKDLRLPQHIGRKYDTYSVTAAVPQEAMLNTLDAFINLAVSKFLLMDHTRVNIVFEVRGASCLVLCLLLL